MSEVGFTRGPWVADLGETYRICAENGQTVAWATFVFSTPMHSGRRETKTVAANSHLIAAAPELYEALEATLEQAIGCFHNHYGEDPSGTPEPEYIQKARAALAKARGETP